jgi:diphthine-ammonia ligase
LNMLKESFSLDGIAYGDIYTDAHFEWGENTAAAAGLKAIFPLRAEPVKAAGMLEEFIDTGYKAIVIRIRKDRLTSDFLGKQLDWSFAEKITETDCCPMGENGEYHTFVYDGPLFQEAIPIHTGKVIESDTTYRLELSLS